jgi:hypothetical protein
MNTIGALALSRPEILLMERTMSRQRAGHVHRDLSFRGFAALRLRSLSRWSASRKNKREGCMRTVDWEKDEK